MAITDHQIIWQYSPRVQYMMSDVAKKKVDNSVISNRNWLI